MTLSDDIRKLGEAKDGKTPDPTVLTTEQLLREVDNATKLLEAKIDGVEEVTRERFESVKTAFGLNERQRVEQKADTEKAVQAALSAAKEAVKEQTAASEKSITKSETATAEQLKQLGATFTQAINGVGVSISDLKERVSKIESIKQGSFEQRAETSTATSQLLTVIAVIISAAVLGLALYAALH